MVLDWKLIPQIGDLMIISIPSPPPEAEKIVFFHCYFKLLQASTLLQADPGLLEADPGCFRLIQAALV